MLFLDFTLLLITESCHDWLETDLLPLPTVVFLQAAMGSEYNAINPLITLPPVKVTDELWDSVKPIKDLIVEDDEPFRKYKGKSPIGKLKLALFAIFPLLGTLATYNYKWIVGDVIAGCTIASLAVPQDLAYARLARMPPVMGLYSSFSPPLIYSLLGSSRHIAVGPVSVVSSLIANLATDLLNSTVPDPSGKIDKKTGKTAKLPNKDYVDLVITATFFAGVIQFGMGFFRLGFVVDFLSHAASVGFMAGAATTIALGQLQGLLGYTDYSPKTDLIRIFKFLHDHHDQFNWRAFSIGISFLVYLLVLKYTSKYFKKNRILFFINALGPLTSVVIATAIVYGTRADKHGVKKVGHIKKGVNPSSLDQIRFGDFFLDGMKLGNFGKDGVKIGLIAGLVALTEAVAIGRTFAAKEGYHIDGNQEMVAFGASNIVGSLTSCFVVTGSFSRSAVNYTAGAKSVLSNAVMAIVILIILLFMTPLVKYLPIAVLAAIIICALSGLVDFHAAWQVWKTDKFDFIVLLGAFFGVLFISIEVGILIAVVTSFIRVILQVARPHTAILGQVPNSNFYRSVLQYPQAEQTDGIMVLRVDATIYFANANYLREKVERIALEYETKSRLGVPLRFVILELTPVADIDSTGVHSLEELYRALQKNNIQLAVSNPSKVVLVKFQRSGFAQELSESWLFLSVNDGVKTCRALLGKDSIADFV